MAAARCRLQSEQTLLQLVVIEADADAAGNAGNVSFWLTVGEVPSASPEGLIVTTGNTRGLTNAVSLFDNVEAQILNMLIRTVHQKVSTLTVLVESGYQGCDNVRTIAAQWNLLVVVQVLAPQRVRGSYVRPNWQIICHRPSLSLAPC